MRLVCHGLPQGKPCAAAGTGHGFYEAVAHGTSGYDSVWPTG